MAHEEDNEVAIVVSYNTSVLGAVSRERFEQKLQKAVEQIASVPFSLSFRAQTVGFSPVRVKVLAPGADPEEAAQFAQEIEQFIIPQTFNDLLQGLG